MKQNLLLLWATFFLCTSCDSPHKINNDELKQIIIDKYKMITTTLQNGDETYVVNMHTDDAVLFKADGLEVVGIIALREFYKQVAASHVTINSNPISVEKLSEDIAFEFGTFNSTTTKGKKNSAKYMNIWKRVGKDWKILKAIDHSKIAK
jgi:ketosteroid isomerase-like protein